MKLPKPATKIMRAILFTISLTIFAKTGYFCNSQTILPIMSNTRVKGAYGNFGEFKQNQPSLKLEFNMVPKNVYGNGKEYSYYLIKDQNKKDIKFKNVWGLCDGENVYIAGGKDWLLRNHFFKLENIGRYCVYYTVDVSMDISGNDSGSKVEVIGHTININNGKDYVVNQAVMEKIIERDSTLFAEYDKDRYRKKYEYAEFIRQYSDRHPEEIK